MKAPQVLGPGSWRHSVHSELKTDDIPAEKLLSQKIMQEKSHNISTKWELTNLWLTDACRRNISDLKLKSNMFATRPLQQQVRWWPWKASKISVSGRNWQGSKKNVLFFFWGCCFSSADCSQRLSIELFCIYFHCSDTINSQWQELLKYCKYGIYFSSLTGEKLFSL